MLVNIHSNPSLANIPAFTSSIKIKGLFEPILIKAIPLFIDSFKQTFNKTTLSETDFSQNFGIALDRYIKNTSEIKLCVRENSKDIYRSGANNKKMPDFVFFSSELKADIIPLYNIEAKRLPTDKLGSDREKEYVCGLSKKDSGGMERFKSGSHGYGLKESAILGYIEDETFSHWHSIINGWIEDKALERPTNWNSEEKLQELEVDQSESYSVSRSVVNRLSSDSIELCHLWIKIS